MWASSINCVYSGNAFGLFSSLRSCFCVEACDEHAEEENAPVVAFQWYRTPQPCNRCRLMPIKELFYCRLPPHLTRFPRNFMSELGRGIKIRKKSSWSVAFCSFANQHSHPSVWSSSIIEALSSLKCLSSDPSLQFHRSPLESLKLHFKRAKLFHAPPFVVIIYDLTSVEELNEANSFLIHRDAPFYGHQCWLLY